MNWLTARAFKERRLVLLACAVLLGMTRIPARASEPVTVWVKTGEAVDLFLSLGADDRRDLALRAVLVRGPDWPEGAVIGFPRDGGLTMVRDVPFDPAGRRLHLSVEALDDPPPGTYKASIELLGDAGGPSLVSVPLAVSIGPGSGNGWRWAGAATLASLVGALFFFAWTSLAHSRFLRADQLAARLEPLRWSEAGGTERVPRMASEIEGQIARQLTRYRPAGWRILRRSHVT